MEKAPIGCHFLHHKFDPYFGGHPLGQGFCIKYELRKLQEIHLAAFFKFGSACAVHKYFLESNLVTFTY